MPQKAAAPTPPPPALNPMTNPYFMMSGHNVPLPDPARPSNVGPPDPLPGSTVQGSALSLKNILPDAVPRSQQVPITYVDKENVSLLGTHGLASYWNGGALSPLFSALGSNGQIVAGTQAQDLPGSMGPNLIGHEAGHAIWVNDLTERQRADWYAIHKSEMLSTLPKPPAIALYPDDPSHSFAETMRQYSYYPANLQAQSPKSYEYFKDLLGFEYSRKNTSKPDPISPYINNIPVPQSQQESRVRHSTK